VSQSHSSTATCSTPRGRDHTIGSGSTDRDEYRRRPGFISIIHTEIDSARMGEGLGTLLVEAALDTARARGLAVLPYCPFVQSFIDRHREYLDLVPFDRRAKFSLDAG
jgi:uncharacterized protein